MGFGSFSLRGQFHSREKNAFPRGQDIRLNIQPPQHVNLSGVNSDAVISGASKQQK